MHRLVGVVPARGGSKRIPKKNLRCISGKPLIGYAIETGLACPSIERVIVSSDDEETIKIAKDFNAEVPFVRPKELAGDYVPDGPVFVHVINWLKQKQGYEFDFLVNLRCTTPMKSVSDIENVYARLLETNADSIRTVTPVNDVNFHPFWVLEKKDIYGKYLLEDIDRRKLGGRRQYLPKVWRFNAMVDIMRVEQILKDPENPYGDKMAIYEISESRAFDIDTELDFKICKYLMENMNSM